jgi:GNAT superfamily N-acetyltransferase
MEITIRRAKWSDRPAFTDLFRVLHSHHVRLEPAILRPLADPSGVRPIGKFIGRKDAVLFVAEANGRVIGLAGVIKQKRPAPMFRKKVYALLENLVVAYRYRNQGVATKLIKAVKMWAKGKGFSILQVGVWARNTGAIGLYEKEGFRDLTKRMEVLL